MEKMIGVAKAKVTEQTAKFDRRIELRVEKKNVVG